MVPPSRAYPLVALVTLMIGSVAPTSAVAANPRALGIYKDWSAFLLEDGGQRVCYMATQPKKMEGQTKGRGEAYLLVTHRPADKSFDVVSIIAGYSYKPGSDVTVTVGKDRFRLFTDRDTAWARDDATDHKLASVLRSGSQAVVKGLSARNTQTTDTYSLSGSGGAYQAISSACGVRR